MHIRLLQELACKSSFPCSRVAFRTYMQLSLLMMFAPIIMIIMIISEMPFASEYLFTT